MRDGAVYLGAIIVGLFVVGLCGAATEATYWPHFAVGYLALLLYATVMAGWSIYRAKHISDWRQSLAKLPLRPAGYGTKRGKALEAAHGQPAVRTAMIAFTIASIVIVGALGYIVFRPF